jgi:two-component system, NarL family, sensor histidine kinase DesK
VTNVLTALSLPEPGGPTPLPGTMWGRWQLRSRPPPRSPLRPGVYGLGVVTRTRRESSAEDVIRLASAGATGLSVAIPLVTLAVYATSPSLTNHLPEAAAGSAVYVSLYVRHVRLGLRGERPRALPFTLAAMAVVTIGLTPLLGVAWLFTFSALVASLLITTRLRWSLPSVVGILIGASFWAAALGVGAVFPDNRALGLVAWVPLGVMTRASAVFVLVWLVQAVRRVQAGRLALAAASLGAERERIDMELSASVGAELEAIVQLSISANAGARGGSPMAESELQVLVAQSRGALASARKVISRFTLAPPEAELHRALLLLRAAGVDATVELPEAGLPTSFSESTRSALHGAVADLLEGDVGVPMVLKLSGTGTECRVEAVRAATEEPAA